MTFGVVVVRHVNSEQTNKYWIECLRCIRKYYPFEKVLIVDDASNPEFLESNGVNMTNVEIVESEFPKRGELLGYYYFHKRRPFEKAIILHDSMFIQRRINVENINLALLWSFPLTLEAPYRTGLIDHIIQTNNDPEGDIRLLRYLKNSESLIEVYNSRQWKGCFGVMSVISSVTLDYFVEKYDLFNLLDHVNTRQTRMNVERVFGVICSLETKIQTVCGDIFNHPCAFYLTFQMYQAHIQQEDKRLKNIYKFNKKSPVLEYPILKVWTGR
jgi:hypothetical protein